MSIIPLALAKAHLNLAADADDEVVRHLIDAAEAHLATLLGYAIEERFPEPPADLRQAVLLLVGHWYENRESTVVGLSVMSIPFGVHEIVQNRRDWTV